MKKLTSEVHNERGLDNMTSILNGTTAINLSHIVDIDLSTDMSIHILDSSSILSKIRTIMDKNLYNDIIKRCHFKDSSNSICLDQW